ncbi:MAG: cytochrome c3 family protein [Bryobacterales bacterium]
MRFLPLIIASAAALATLATAQQLPKLQRMRPGPEQPIPFHHVKHSAQGLACQMCHPTPEPGVFADIVGTETCMGCHSSIKTDSPAIQKLADYHKRGEPVPWEPIYMVPEYVYFSHDEHAAAGASCADCHGDVGSAEVLAKERDISMAACMDCHRAKGASVGCGFCHDPRGTATPPTTLQ